MKVTATTYEKGEQLQTFVFDTYIEALRWVRATTGVEKAVCIKNDTAFAAHKPDELARWTIEPAR